MNLSPEDLRKKRIQLYKLKAAELKRIALKDLSPEDLRVKKECEGSLLAFCKHAWHVLEPENRKMLIAWPLEAMCEHLEAVSDGEIRRLLINVPPGSMKPVAEDALVLTKEKGLIPLKNIEIGDFVWTHKSRWRRVLEVHVQGKLPVLELTTNRGRIVSAAHDHPFLTPSGWEKIENLKVDDVVGISSCTEECGSKTTTPELARLLGYLIGDGCCSGTPNITCADDRVAADIEHSIKSIGFLPTVQEYHMANTGYRLRRISIKGKEREPGGRKKGYMGPVKRWLSGYGLLGKTSYNKKIPECIMMGDNQIVREFIGAYWSCDGYTSSKGAKKDGSERRDLFIGCDSVNRDFLLQLQILFSRLGINSTIRKKITKIKTKRQGDVYTSYHLGLSGQDDCWRFAQLIHFYHSKYDKMMSVFNRRFDFDRQIWGDVVVSVLPNGEKECRCLSVEEDQSFCANGFIVHNSLLTRVFWPAWEWGPRGDAWLRYISASFNNDLSIRDAKRMRDIILSPWYQRLWPHVKLSKDQSEKANFENTHKGFLRTIVVSGTTGFRGDRVLVDDPHDVSDAESDAVRMSTVQWFKEAIPSRLNDFDESAIVVIMQRVHEEDVSGQILSSNKNYVHVCIPLYYESDRHCSTKIGWEDPRTVDGENFWPDRYTQSYIDEVTAEGNMGSYAISAQFQQSPAPRGGGIIKRKDWRLWGNPKDSEDAYYKSYPHMEFTLTCLDPAYTEKQENDYSGCCVLGIFKDENYLTRIMLMYAAQWRLDLHPLVNKVAETCKKYRSNKLLIESKASGLSVAQEVHRLYQGEPWAVQTIDPKGDKVARAYSVQHLFEQGLVYAPDKDFADLAIDQCAIFPKGKHDDIVDAVTMGIRWLRDTGWALRNEEREAVLDSIFMPKGKQVALYDV